MFGKYNGLVSKARVSACMYFLVRQYIGKSTTPLEIAAKLYNFGHPSKIEIW
jgi:hypothetical protein